MNGEGEPILKKTLTTMAVMVGALVAFVGTVSLVAVLVTSHAVGGSASEEADVASAPSAASNANHAKTSASRGSHDTTPAANPHGHDTI